MQQGVKLGLNTHVRDRQVLENAVTWLRRAHIVLPTLAELAEPFAISSATQSALGAIEKNQRHPLNLFRIHWHNRSGTPDPAVCPDYFILPSELTGVEARIVVVPGDEFPFIGAHKVLAAYACLVARIVTGQFDPASHRAIWPSTGNYCRGGIAISRVLGCRGVAVLPEGMSRERFDWLKDWVLEPKDIVTTPGAESNVKEIYDKCNELVLDDRNVIFNQFSEFANYLAHFHVTGVALSTIFEDIRDKNAHAKLASFVASSGSAGTLAAGDFLKDRYGSFIAAVEALECPTLLYNGFGEHNIQGIGDKHVPLIHNVMNTDYVIGVSDRSTDSLNLLFNSETGLRFLSQRKGVAANLIREGLSRMGLSSIANALAAIKLAKHRELGPDDVILVVATDGASMYRTEHAKAVDRHYGGEFGELDAAETYGEHLSAQNTSDMIELDRKQRERIFNLGYFTWVEQQGVAVEDFTARRAEHFWSSLQAKLVEFDQLVFETNRRITSGR